ncbi:tetratricopeptide repeat protein [Aeromonas dhakensis]|uniref:tetratricopeptide repeat protein n=1 Tax=Aeromonas dhakensis TaxID=196024 RepID=UPI00191F427F|nr:tetratricopeptide repeat protein [Aeromonas dhakensis]MBL0460824.1 SEL1-like repeat protein [Aeromonas dhakensis]
MDKYEQPKEITALKENADAGDAIAQFELGQKYRLGQGVKRNNSEAFHWYKKSAEQGESRSQNAIGVMYKLGLGVKKDYKQALIWYQKSAAQGNSQAQFNLGLMHLNGQGVDKNYSHAKELFHQAAASTDSDLRFKAIEYQDRAARYLISPEITEIRKKILRKLKVDILTSPQMTHYTSLVVGSALLLDKSPLRLGHINSLNDPNEGKLLWRYLGYAQVERNPVFVGCFLPDDDSLNMWRFYSKDHQNDDACGCAITFDVDNFFDFNLLKEIPTDEHGNDDNTELHSTGKIPQESLDFYRIIYVKDDMDIQGDDKANSLRRAFKELNDEVTKYISHTKDNDKFQNLSRLLGPLPYLIKDADYEAEKEHRIIISHLEYGAKEIQSQAPDLENGIPPKLYLELHRTNHLDPVKHVTLGPKAPNQEMMIPYWYHKLMSDFAVQLKSKKDFYIRASTCAYQ